MSTREVQGWSSGLETGLESEAELRCQTRIIHNGWTLGTLEISNVD